MLNSNLELVCDKNIKQLTDIFKKILNINDREKWGIEKIKEACIYFAEFHAKIFEMLVKMICIITWSHVYVLKSLLKQFSC